MVGIVSSIVSYAEQRFATLPTSIVGEGVAFYEISLRYPGGSYGAVPNYSFIFPMSPQGIRKENATLNTIYDVQGDASNAGVQRMADMWGQALPVYSVRGTTGWKKHSTDFFMYSGKDSIKKILSVFVQYAKLNQGLMKQNATNFYSLEFYDYWMEEYWEIVPIGNQTIDQDANRPLLTNYNFRFAAVRAVNAPMSALALDAVVALWSAGAQQIEIANSALTTTLNSY